jgi:ATP-dependent DNA helicase RecG
VTRPTAFATLDQPEAWPRLRGAPRPERLEARLESLAGVGPRIAGRLRKLGLVTIRDLLGHRPRDYQRSVGESRIVDLFGEQEAVIVGEVRSVSLRRTRRRLTVLKATVADDSGSIPAVWFNQDWLKDKLQPGTRVRLRGQLRRNEFNVKSYDLNGAAATADLAPIYPAGEEITPPRMRALADRALELVPTSRTRSRRR